MPLISWGGGAERGATMTGHGVPAREGLTLNRELGGYVGRMHLPHLPRHRSRWILGDPERAEALYGESLAAAARVRRSDGPLLRPQGDGVRSLFARRCDPRGAIVGGRRSRKCRPSACPSRRSTVPTPITRACSTPRARGCGDEAAWEAALDEGRAMTPEEAADCALGTEEVAAPSSEDDAAPPCSPSAKPRCCAWSPRG